MGSPGLKQVFALPHRTDVMLNEQLCLVQDAQANLEKALGSLKRSETEEESAYHMAQVQALKTRTDELLVMLQLLVKIRTELAHSMRDVDKARKEGREVKSIRKRVGWLEDRLEKLLLSRRKARRTRTRQALETRREPLIGTIPTNSMMPGVVVIPPEEAAIPLFTPQVTTGSRQMLQQQRQRHVDGGLFVVNEASTSQQSGSLSAGGLEVSSSTIRSSVSGDQSSWVTESEEETNSESETLQSEDESSTVQDSAAEAVQSSETVALETSNRSIEKSLLSIDSACQSHVSVTASIRLVGQGQQNAKKRDDLAVISQTWSVKTDTLPVTHKSVANYGALLMSRESRSGQNPQFITLKTDSQTEVFSEPMPEPHVHSPPRPLARPPTIHTQYEFIEGYGIDDPLSWHRLGLAVESSFIPSRTQRTPIPWRARTVHSILGSKDTNEKLELEHSGFERLSQRIDKMYSFVESTADDLAGHRMPEMRKGSKSRSSTPSRLGSAKPGRRSPGLLTNSVHASVYASIPELEMPSVGESLHRAVTDRNRCYPLNPRDWTGGVSPTSFRVKRVASQSRQSDAGVDVQERTVSRGQTSSMSVWKKTAKNISVAARLQLPSTQKPRDIFGQKAKCIEHIVNDQLMSPIAADRREAAKSLGLLHWKDRFTINGLKDRVVNDSDELVQMEASKALLSLGVWEDCVVKIISSALRRGTKDLQNELLNAIANADNVKLVDKRKVRSFPELVSTVKSLVMATDKDLAFSAALCLAEMCVYDPMAKQVLLGRLDDSNYGVRALALEVLIRQMNCFDDCVIDGLLSQLKNSFSSKDRSAAAKLLGHLNVNNVSLHHSVELLNLLERKLWDDPMRDVREAAAGALKSVGRAKETRRIVAKQLEDPDDHVRAQAATSLGTLRVQDSHQLRLLLDLIELDPSTYVRIQAVRAVAVQGVVTSAVTHLLKEREKGEGPLAREAARALRSLKQSSS